MMISTTSRFLTNAVVTLKTFGPTAARNIHTVTRPLNAAFATPNSAPRSGESAAREHQARKINEGIEPKVRLFASVCIERMPVITCDANDLEKRYLSLINEMNIRNSYLSDHELRHIRDIERLKKKQKSKESGGDAAGDEDLLIETALDYEEKCLKELNAIKLGERKLSVNIGEKSGEDASGKFRNFDYVLDKKLILLVNEPDTSNWHLPQLEWTQNDTSLRITAEKAVKNLEEKLHVDFLGNAPFGVFKNKTDDLHLNKYYFFKAQYKSGADSLAQSKADYVWIRKDELKDFIKDKTYLDCLMNFILDF